MHIAQYIDVRAGEVTRPTVFLSTESGDFGGSVHLTAGEAEQVGQAMVEAARFIQRG